MKILNTLAIIGISAITFAFNPPAEIAVATWESTEINVGEIDRNVPVDVEFELTNSGNAPLIITNVRPTCGCTVADYPRTPIAPGESAIIKGTYNARSLGTFRKTIAVQTNAENPNQNLVIRGTVVE